MTEFGENSLVKRPSTSLRIGTVFVAMVALFACAPGNGRDIGYASSIPGAVVESPAQSVYDPIKRAENARSDLPARPARSSDEELGGPALDLTLEDAIRYALENNRSLLNLRLDREVQKLSLDVEEERWQPKFTITPALARDSSNNKRASVGANMTLRLPTGGVLRLNWDQSVSSRAEGNRSQSLGISHPLLRGAGSDVESVSIRRARINERMNILAMREAVVGVVNEVIGAYRSVVSAYRQLDIAEASLARAREQLESTRALIRVGRVAEREVGRSEASIANREIALARARNGLEVANAALVSVLDTDGVVLVRPLGERDAEPGPLSAPAFEDVLLSRTDFIQAQMRVELARMSLTVARNNLLLDPSIGLDLNRDRTGRSATSVNLGVTIPLNDRAPKVEHIQARNSLIKAQRNVIEMRESIHIALRQAVNDVEARTRLVELARNARTLAEDNLAVEEAKFGQGLSSTFQVTAAEDELVNAERAEADAVQALSEAFTRLDQTTGRTLERWGIRLEEVVR